MVSELEEERWRAELDYPACPICLDLYEAAVILPCRHIFCWSCCNDYGQEEGQLCPICRKDFPGRNLKINRTLASVAEKARQLNAKMKEQEDKVHCEEHQLKADMLCNIDNEFLCHLCVFKPEHRHHSFMEIESVVQKYKRWMKFSLDSIEQEKSATLELEQRQKQKISAMREQWSSLQTHITSKFILMHQFLTEEEQRFVRELREEEERILETMERNLREIQENLNIIQENLSKLHELKEQKDGVIFTKEETSQNERIGECCNKLSLADGKLSIEKFSGPLPYAVWREMLNTAKLVSVTLDVETANPWLEVSEDLKSVRWTRTRRNVPDTGKRFTISPCVLGSEGFTAGRHYWEVEVAGNRGWSLGVAAESVDRKGGNRQSPETGFWTIEQIQDQHNVNSSPRSPLPVVQIPRKVGVYLSYEFGTVLFYSPDTKSLLHTFTGNKFTNKLCPFFWTSDANEQLKICSGSDLVL